MARKGMNIYKRKDGRWEGRYRAYSSDLNSYKYCSVYGKSYSEVKEKLEIRKAEKKVPDKKCSLTVENLFMLWLGSIESKIKESTRANYFFKLNKHILPAIGAIRYDSINALIINDFISMKRKQGLSDKYIRDMLSLLKSLGKYAKKAYGFKDCFTDDDGRITTLKPKEAEIVVYPKQTQGRLINRLIKTINPTNLGILLSFYTGIRIGELCALRWGDIEDGYINITHTLQRIYDNDNKNSNKKTKIIISEPKSKKSKRIVPIPSFLVKMISNFRADDKCYVLSGTEKFVEPRLMLYRFKSFQKKENLPSISYHSLRHMFATNSIALGFDIKSLSELLGHSSIEITLSRYVHTDIERKKELMDRHCLIS